MKHKALFILTVYKLFFLVYWARCIEKGGLQGLALLTRKIFFFQMDGEQGKKIPHTGDKESLD